MKMITRLQYFNCVVETGSISEASRLFDIQPSSVSRQLVALEAELGVRLLNRTTRSVGLTEAGQTFYRYSQRVVAELEEAKKAVNDLQESPRGHLKVSMTVGFGECVVLPLLPKFRQQYPEINVELELTERVVDFVDENIDIAIRSGRLPDSNLIAKRLADNNFLLCASPEYLSGKRDLQSPTQLADFDCIRYGYAGWRDWFLMDGGSPTRLQINPNLTINTVNGQKQLVLNHAGLALLPLWAVHDELRKGTVIQVLPDFVFSPYDVMSSTYALYLKRELVSPKIRVFIDFISQHING
ncbi:transcriptional regulator [Photobacterium sanguinicancri]|uniref:Transcriptional regulator n=2 Tax=Photobacterium sanguinicancri TaxID=875932 RepID=A0ABX4FYY3_9GAMM|nr:transcriptional regulator [Photobacterium sanguinicancri]